MVLLWLINVGASDSIQGLLRLRNVVRGGGGGGCCLMPSVQQEVVVRFFALFTPELLRQQGKAGCTCSRNGRLYRKSNRFGDWLLAEAKPPFS